MVTSVWGTENNHRGINQGSRADDWARTLVFGLKILVQQLPSELVHCCEEETNCLVLSTQAGRGKSSSIGLPEHSNKNFTDSLSLRDKLVVNNSLAVVETHKHCLHFWLLKTNFFAFWWCWWLPFNTLVFSCGIIAKTPSFILCYNRIQEIFISTSSFNDVFCVQNTLVSLIIRQWMCHKPGSDLSLAQVFHEDLTNRRPVNTRLISHHSHSRTTFLYSFPHFCNESLVTNRKWTPRPGFIFNRFHTTFESCIPPEYLCTR